MRVQEGMNKKDQEIIDVTSEHGPDATAVVHQPAQSTAPAPQATELDRMVAYDEKKKSMATAYIIWWLAGVFGGHRFYLGKSGSATAMLCISLLSLPLMLVVIGLFTITIPFIWALVDLFLIPGWIREHNQTVANSLGIQTLR